MIFLLALVALLAFAAGFLAGSEYHWRFDRRAEWPRARRDEWPGS